MPQKYILKVISENHDFTSKSPPFVDAVFEFFLFCINPGKQIWGSPSCSLKHIILSQFLKVAQILKYDL